MGRNLSQCFHCNVISYFKYLSSIDFNYNVICTWSGQSKNILLSFDGYSLFPLSLILVLSESIFLGDLKIAILFFFQFSVNLHLRNQSNVSCNGWPGYLIFSLTCFYEKIYIISKVMDFTVFNCLMKIIDVN